MDEAEKPNFCPTSLKAQAADWSENSSSGWGVGVGMLNVWFWCFLKVAYSGPAQTGICQSDQNYYMGTITDSQHFQPSDSVVGERTCRTKSWESSHTKNPTSVSKKASSPGFWDTCSLVILNTPYARITPASSLMTTHTEQSIWQARWGSSREL